MHIHLGPIVQGVTTYTEQTYSLQHKFVRLQPLICLAKA